MSDEVEKLCTIANGMCAGQCEGPTIYEVVDNRSVDRTRNQTQQTPP